MPAAGRSAPAFMQTLPGISARGLKRRSQTEKKTGSNTDHEGEEEDGRAHMNIVRARKISREKRDQCLDSGQRHRQTERAANEGDQQALSQQLSNDARPRSAQSQANGDLPLPGSRSG